MHEEKDEGLRGVQIRLADQSSGAIKHKRQSFLSKRFSGKTGRVRANPGLF
jgi:hypothetical protein